MCGNVLSLCRERSNVVTFSRFTYRASYSQRKERQQIEANRRCQLSGIVDSDTEEQRDIKDREDGRIANGEGTKVR